MNRVDCTSGIRLCYMTQLTLGDYLGGAYLIIFESREFSQAVHRKDARERHSTRVKFSIAALMMKGSWDEENVEV